MNYYRKPEQLRAAVETATAMERLLQQYSPEELVAMGFDLSSHADPDPDRPYAHLVAAEMLRHAHDTTANTPLGRIVFDEHRRSAGLLTTEELALRATCEQAAGSSEIQLANAPLASLRTVGVDTPYKDTLALDAGGAKIDGAIS